MRRRASRGKRRFGNAALPRLLRTVKLRMWLAGNFTTRSKPPQFIGTASTVVGSILTGPSFAGLTVRRPLTSQPASRGNPPLWVENSVSVDDSPLEGARFEPSVPGAKRVGSVPSRLTPRVDAYCLFPPRAPIPARLETVLPRRSSDQRTEPIAADRRTKDRSSWQARDGR